MQTGTSCIESVTLFTCNRQLGAAPNEQNFQPYLFCFMVAI